MIETAIAADQIAAAIKAITVILIVIPDAGQTIAVSVLPVPPVPGGLRAVRAFPVLPDPGGRLVFPALPAPLALSLIHI